ncbi:MAG: hypothetical protein U0175_12675 [Caldilineaceae bacterium]
MNTQRLFGLLGMICSPLFLIYSLTTGLQETTLLGSTLGLLFQFGCLCCAIGLLAERATGDGMVGRSILFVQMTLHTLAMIFQVLEYKQIAVDSLLFTITDIAWPLGFLFMLVTGTAVIRAQRWLGWRRYVPVLCALPLPVTMLAGGLVGMEIGGYLFGLGLMVTYLLLGYAVFSYNQDETEMMVAQPTF